MVQSKARFSFKQYIKNKPTKWGFKLWVLCDSHTGYTNNFVIYRGKEGESVSTNGLSYDVVMNLASPYLNQGYRIYMDNFYTSVKLLKDLYANETHGTGTMASNRRGFLEQIKTTVSIYKAKPRGSGVYMRINETVINVWKDTKCVVVGSTEHPGHSENTVERNWKDKGTRQKQNVPIPLPIYNYNKFMGGVDRSDQLLKYYEVVRITKKYWKTIFYHLVDLSAVNAFILHKIVSTNPKITHFQFRENLVRSLCCAPELLSTPGSGSGRPTNCDTVKHYLIQGKRKELGDCVYCKASHKKEANAVRYVLAVVCHFVLGTETVL